MRTAKMSAIPRLRSAEFLSRAILVLGVVVWLGQFTEAAPMSTAFTYQGRLLDDNMAADGLYDFQFSLYDDPNFALGIQVGRSHAILVSGHLNHFPPRLLPLIDGLLQIIDENADMVNALPPAFEELLHQVVALDDLH